MYLNVLSSSKDVLRCNDDFSFNSSTSGNRDLNGVILQLRKIKKFRTVCWSRKIFSAHYILSSLENGDKDNETEPVNIAENVDNSLSDVEKASGNFQ